MKAGILIMACVEFLVGCQRDARVLNVSQAHAALKPGEVAAVVVAGYLVSHFEGDSLEMQPGDPTGDGISLLFTSHSAGTSVTRQTIVRTLGGLYDQQYVTVRGNLKRGVFQSSLGPLPDMVFVEVVDIRVPDRPPVKTPKPYRQFPQADARKG